jgi:hypothetical protein
MLEMMTSKADRAVMAVTLNRVSGGTGIRCDAQTLPDLVIDASMRPGPQLATMATSSG